MMRTSTQTVPCTESPRFGGRGRGSLPNTPRSRHPKGFGPVGVTRERPLQRSRVKARREAVFVRGR